MNINNVKHKIRIMKCYSNKFTILVPLLIGISTSCHKDDWKEIILNKTEIPDCGCNQKILNHYENYQTIVSSIKDSTIWNSDIFDAILFNPDSSKSIFVVKNYNMVAISTICNFPNEMKSWNLTNQNSINVIVSGDFYESCKPLFSTTNITHSDFKLTKFCIEK
jgi:hypothetical protein